jgi:hypothetical protein
MFYPVDFEYQSVVVQHTCEPILPDTEFLERPTRERFEVVIRIAPPGADHFV